MSPRRLAVAATALAVGLPAGAARAHSPIPGIEGFYAGLIHPVTSPGQILALASLGVLLGQARGSAGSAWAGFACAMLAGIAAGQFGAQAERADLPLFAVAAVTAALAALLPRRAGSVAIILGACGGFAVGLSSTPDAGPFRATAITLAGSFTGANLGLLYLAGIAGWVRDRFRARWAQVGLRVIAAWIAAVAMLMAALIAADDRDRYSRRGIGAANPFHLVNLF